MCQKVSLLDVADIKFCIVNPSKQAKVNFKWIMPANLIYDNTITGDFENKKIRPDESLRIYQNDIIIKRINPYYINFIDIELGDIYAYNNLIIIRAKTIEAKYLAYYLGRKIKDFSKNTSVGAVMPSIGRPEFESFKIPIISINEQKAIGELWYKSIEKKKMRIKISNLEHEKELYFLNKYVDKKIGGHQYDNI